jgi:hypothetical protein
MNARNVLIGGIFLMGATGAALGFEDGKTVPRVKLPLEGSPAFRMSPSQLSARRSGGKSEAAPGQRPPFAYADMNRAKAAHLSGTLSPAAHAAPRSMAERKMEQRTLQAPRDMLRLRPANEASAPYPGASGASQQRAATNFAGQRGAVIPHPAVPH